MSVKISSFRVTAGFLIEPRLLKWVVSTQLDLFYWKSGSKHPALLPVPVYKSSSRLHLLWESPGH